MAAGIMTYAHGTSFLPHLQHSLQPHSLSLKQQLHFRLQISLPLNLHKQTLKRLLTNQATCLSDTHKDNKNAYEYLPQYFLRSTAVFSQKYSSTSEEVLDHNTIPNKVSDY